MMGIFRDNKSQIFRISRHGCISNCRLLFKII